jgi:hypothetical protein
VLVLIGLGFVVGSQLVSGDPSRELIRPLARLAAVLAPDQAAERPSLLPPVSAGSSGVLEQVALTPPPAEVLRVVPASRDAFERAAAHLYRDRDRDPNIGAPWSPARMVRWAEPPAHRSDLAGPLRVEYTMDVELTRIVFHRLRRGRVSQGHVIVLDSGSGRVLAYASSDPDGFPATDAYPAASLVKIVTAAAALDAAPEKARRACRYLGSPYRLTPSRVNRPRYGNEMSLERSLATSNNQCFAQLAVHAIGGDALLGAIERFGWLEAPAPGHATGSASAGDSDYDLGRLGSGLAGARITPLHAAQLAASLARGQLIEPWWVERVVDVHGRVLPLPRQRAPRRVMSPELAAELRGMLVRTTTRGTARSAFRDRRGRNRLGDIEVAAKTGTLTGEDPYGRYEWFVAVAPAEAPRVAVAVLQLQSDLWWVRSSQLGAEVLSAIFCDGQVCRADLASRYTAGSRQVRLSQAAAALGG